MSQDEQKRPTLPDMLDAIFGTWDGQKRKRGLLERVATIEWLLKLALPIVVLRSLGVPTDIASKFFASPAQAADAFHQIAAVLLGVPK